MLLSRSSFLFAEQPIFRNTFPLFNAHVGVLPCLRRGRSATRPSRCIALGTAGLGRYRDLHRHQERFGPPHILSAPLRISRQLSPSLVHYNGLCWLLVWVYDAGGSLALPAARRCPWQEVGAPFALHSPPSAACHGGRPARRCCRVVRPGVRPSRLPSLSRGASPPPAQCR